MLCELVLECKIYLGALTSSLDLLTALFVTYNSFWQFVLHVLIDGKKFYLCVGILYNHVLTNWFIENQFAWQFILAGLFSYFSFHLFSCVYSLCHSHHFLIHLTNSTYVSDSFTSIVSPQFLSHMTDSGNSCYTSISIISITFCTEFSVYSMYSPTHFEHSAVSGNSCWFPSSWREIST